MMFRFNRDMGQVLHESVPFLFRACGFQLPSNENKFTFKDKNNLLMENPTYSTSRYRFSIYLVFIGLLFLMGIMIDASAKYLPNVSLGYRFIGLIVTTTLCLVFYNKLPSRFQTNRRLIKSFTGGVGVFLLHASWPFGKLLVYEDGIEIRFMFHCYYISYEKMAMSTNFLLFIGGVIIESDLPNVPKSIRFSGFKNREIYDLIKNCGESHVKNL